MLNDEKQIKGSKYILGAFIIVAVFIIAFHLLGRTGISDNGNRTNNTGKQLQQLGTNQQELTGEIREAGKIIKESREILATIRARGPAGDRSQD